MKINNEKSLKKTFYVIDLNISENPNHFFFDYVSKLQLFNKFVDLIVKNDLIVRKTTMLIISLM